ncbi:uncharacterized protein [Cardiocondyla obscurior]|uniref:uncharacterized protein isoform X1 n=1 Tax=Cardiocondyla obscurior TaxID=286306 RepID=UPI0039656CC9
MSASPGKLTLKSKKLLEQCSKIAPRKPVKECYCHFAVDIDTRLSKTQGKSVSSCNHCQSKYVLGPIEEIGNKVAETSLISCETLRRVQKIDYEPRSQFLRNVQNKICELQTASLAEQGDYLWSCSRSPSYHRFMSAKIQGTDTKTSLLNERKRVDNRQKSSTSSTAPVNLPASEQSGIDDVVCASSKGTQVSPRKLSKSTLRKTIRSRRQIPESSERSTSKSPTRGKRTARLHKQDCPCYYRNKIEKKTKRFSNNSTEKYDLLDYCEQCWRQIDKSEVEDFMNQEVENLKKYREQNYFETHGSSHTLTSFRSSESLQQYLLNERLFPEPVGKIHKQDCVVTIPSCATKQKKRVHYFSRNLMHKQMYKGAKVK